MFESANLEELANIWWPAHRTTLVAVVPLLGHQLPMPAQNGVRREERADLVQELATQDLAFDGQATTLVVVEQDPFLAVLLLEHLDYHTLVLDDFLLLVVDPPSDNRQQKLPRFETHVAPEWRFRRRWRCRITLDIGRNGAGSTLPKCHSMHLLAFGRFF